MVEARRGKGREWEIIGVAAKKLYEELMELGEVFERNSEAMDEWVVPYRAMEPLNMGVSILI